MRTAWLDVVIFKLTQVAVKPNEDPNIRGDPFKTLIVARLSYDATEHDLEKEFARFGPIERVRWPFICLP